MVDEVLKKKRLQAELHFTKRCKKVKRTQKNLSEVTGITRCFCTPRKMNLRKDTKETSSG